MLRNSLKCITLALVCMPAINCSNGNAASSDSGDADTATYTSGSTDAISPLASWHAGEVVSQVEVDAYGLERCFAVEAIPDSVWQSMQGVSYHDYSPVGRDDLRYIKTLHRDFDGNIRLGELICNKSIANDLCEIFKQLYHEGYPIEMMMSIDRFGGDDNRSMAANNTSCYNCRRTPGDSRLSHHAYGTAVDINPLYNPYVRTKRNGSRQVLPPEGKAYTNRSGSDPRMIKAGDTCHRIFTAHGFKWGGTWRTTTDYQHFEK